MRAPPVGRVSPAIRLSSVDLPQPEWPISVTNSPCDTSRLISRSAWKRPFWVWNTISAFWTWMKFFMGRGSSGVGVGEALGDRDQRPLEQQTHDADDEDGDQDV